MFNCSIRQTAHLGWSATDGEPHHGVMSITKLADGGLHWSNSVDWRGSNFMICTPSLTGTRCRHQNHIHSLRPVLPATHEATAAVSLNS